MSGPQYTDWFTRRNVVYAVDKFDGTGEFKRLSLGLGLDAADLERVRSWDLISKQAARAFKVPLSWIQGIMWAESRGQQHATSPAGAVGLMQIMPDTAALYNVPAGDLRHPGTNIFLSARILRDLMTAKGAAPTWDLPAVASMYNAGPAAGPIAPKTNTERPWGYAEDAPYIHDVVAANNDFASYGTGSAFPLLLAAAGLAAFWRVSK